MLGMRTRMLGSKVSTVGRTSRPVYHSGEPRSLHERIPTPVWRKHVKQRKRDLPHAALVPAVKAKRGGIQLQGPKKRSESRPCAPRAARRRTNVISQAEDASTARIRDAPEVTLRRRQGDIRVGLPAKLPKRADAETQVLRRKSGESIAYKHHTLKRDI